MKLWSELSERFHALFSRTREDRELDEELHFHLDMEAANHLRDGLTPEESRRRARVSFGGTEQVKENVRDARGIRTLERLAQDGHYAIHSLRQAPAFTVIAVFILALGIGTSTAVFAAFDAVMLDDLPATDADRVVALAAQRRTGTTLAVIPDEVDALRRASQTLRDVAGVGTSAMRTPSFDGDRPLDLELTWVTANFFDVLEVRPVLGRLFRPEDGAEGAAPVAVISYQTWQREFGGDPDVLSRRLTRTQSVSFAPYSIVGVVPPGLDYPIGVDYWIPIGGGQLNMDVVARLKPDVTPETARSEFLSIVQALDRDRTVPGSPTAATIRPLTDAVLGEARPVAHCDHCGGGAAAADCLRERGQPPPHESDAAIR
ncbi:MAG: ABC transporter permease [Longimicrobiales bacterium]